MKPRMWFEYFASDGMWPPTLVGVLMRLGGMVVGSILPQALSTIPQIGEASPML